MSPVDDEPKQVIFALAAKSDSLKAMTSFLSNRGWEIQVTTNVKTFLALVLEHSPLYVMICIDHPNVSAAQLPRLVANAFPAVSTMVFVDGKSSASTSKLKNANYEYSLFPPLSGPAVERLVLRIQKDRQKKEESTSQEGEGGTREKSPGAADAPMVIRGEAQGARDAAGEQARQTLLRFMSSGEEDIGSAVAGGAGSGSGTGGTSAGAGARSGASASAESKTASVGSKSASVDPKAAGTGSKASASPAAPKSSSGAELNKSAQATSATNSSTSVSKAKSNTSASIEEDDKAAVKAESGAATGATSGAGVQSPGAQAPADDKTKENLDFGQFGSRALDELIDNPRPDSDPFGPDSGTPEYTDAERAARATDNPVESPSEYTRRQKKIPVFEQGEGGPVRGRKAVLAEDTIIIKATDSAIEAAAVRTGSPKVEKLETATKVVCIAVESTRFSGYLVAALAQHRDIDKRFIATVKARLVDFMREASEDFSTHDTHDLTLQEVEFESWALDQAEFLKKTVHDGHEIAIAFFPRAIDHTPLEVSAREHMLMVDIGELRGDTTVEFDLYVHLPANDKYILYTREKQLLYAGQLERLKARGVEKLHLRKDSQTNIRRYRVRNFLNDKIQEHRSGAGSPAAVPEAARPRKKP